MKLYAILMSFVMAITYLPGKYKDHYQSTADDTLILVLDRSRTEVKPHEFEGENKAFSISLGGTYNPYYMMEGYTPIPKDIYYLYTSIEKIGDYAFYNTSATLAGIEPTVTEIGEYAVGYHDHLDANGNPDYPVQVKGFTISGELGTYAEKYAKDNNFIFSDITVVTHTGIQKRVKYVPGDYDEDGSVTISDAQVALKNYVETFAGNTDGMPVNVRTDVNGDDILDVVDAQLILKYYTKNSVSGADVSWYEIRNNLA